MISKTFSSIVLGSSSHQRLRTSQTLLGVAFCIVFAALQQVEVALGLLDQSSSNLLSTLYLSGLLVSYLVIRSGLSKRFANDPSLTVAQLFYGTTCLAWSYAIHRETRGGVMVISMMLLVFGMFSLTAGLARGLGAYGLAALGVAMVAKRWIDPGYFDLKSECVHLFLASITIAGITVLSMRVGEMRRRLREQKIDLKVALEKNRTLATHDELTGLLNRRAMLEILSGELRRSERAGTCLSVAIVDLDHFKRVNDLYGHAAGDTVLRGFAEAAKAALRETDVLSRWGGEEFLVMLPATSAGDGRNTVDRVQEKLRQRRFDEIEPGLTITFSAGVAECGGIDDLMQSIERSDQAMYRAKKLGRNRCEVFWSAAPQQI